MFSVRLTRNVTAATAIAGLWSIAALSTPASAGSLFFFKGQTKAPRETTCLSFALDAARNQHLQNIRHDNLAVSGTAGDLFAVMTCVGTFVVVMVAGNTGENCKPLAQALFDEVRRIQNIDPG
jgi:hypothetical protein